MSFGAAFVVTIFITGLPVLITLPIGLRSNSGSSSFDGNEVNHKLCFRFIDYRTCSLELLETIPENLTFPAGSIPRSTFDAWQEMLRSATQEIDIAAYKLSLRGKDQRPEYSLGRTIFDVLLQAGRDRAVQVRIAENYPQKDVNEGVTLKQQGNADVRALDYGKLIGAGILHTKFILVDDKHFYVGSANMDWRSLNQKMEFGVLVRNCPCLGADFKRIFNAYWRLTTLNPNSTSKSELNEAISEKNIIQAFSMSINASHPLRVKYNGVPADIYLAASPVLLNNAGRTWDLDAILNTINNAQSYLYIHLMDYIPMMVFSDPQRYWPVIDEALRRAATDRGVELKLLVSALHFIPKTLYFLKSLQSLDDVARLQNGSIEVKIFKVPAMTEFQRQLKGDRRTHNKFLVSEDTCVIGTSNWSGDYFLGTAGVALVVRQWDPHSRPFIDQVRQIFFRDWHSDYVHTLDAYMAACIDASSASLNNEICEIPDTS